MYTCTEDENVISKELWRTWGQRDKLRERATARKRKLISGIVFGLLALASAVFFIVAR
jgi:hypothetical protein